ncbi:uncharacterized protein N0V89_008276 [Didymosphaeria variabile]|uniref:Uncharacterized protein n=1 Tax=Didymosphaeria variabile TaxID=1932322 RepID=A0A9W8XFF9_9PLEO|nr:uncharacterized protein N0V89_008276 [Didymosphaeria variabile]KAJ4349659.1 hypothetical protein N0V89_008276 [Didymosphaeria variabile]
MHFTKFVSTLFLIGAVSAAALPDTEQDQSGLVTDPSEAQDDGNSTEIVTTRSDKAFAQVTTWSGDNCRGSSANHGVGTVKFTCFHTPGHSFSNFLAWPSCVLTTWSGTDCHGSSKRFTTGSSEGCVKIPFGSYSINC